MTDRNEQCGHCDWATARKAPARCGRSVTCYCIVIEYIDNLLCYKKITTLKLEKMTIRFNKRQRRKIRKFLASFHGKEHTDHYDIFQAIAYLVYRGSQWKMLPTYYPRPTTVYNHFRRWDESNNMIIFLQRLVRQRRRKTGRKEKSFDQFRVVGLLNAPMPGLKITVAYAEIMNDIFLQPERWHILPRYSSCFVTDKPFNHHIMHKYNNQPLDGQSPVARPLVDAFLRSFRSRWNPIAPSKTKENPSTSDRPAINIYCRTGS